MTYEEKVAQASATWRAQRGLPPRAASTAQRAPAPAAPRPQPASGVMLSEAAFTELLTRITENAPGKKKAKPVTESATPAEEPSTAELVASVDPVAGSVLQKLESGTPIHTLTHDEHEVVRRAFIRDRHAGAFARGRH